MKNEKYNILFKKKIIFLSYIKHELVNKLRKKIYSEIKNHHRNTQ